MAIEFGDRAALEARVGAAKVVEALDDNGDGVLAGAELDNLTSLIEEANAQVTGILLDKGFTLAQLEKLRDDPQVRRAWSGIAAQLLGERRHDWLAEGGLGPWDALGERARGELKKLASGEIRSARELETDGAGVNMSLRGASTDRPFVFNPDPRNPNDRYGPGGF